MDNIGNIRHQNSIYYNNNIVNQVLRPTSSTENRRESVVRCAVLCVFSFLFL
jgi:hypothetical protein